MENQEKSTRKKYKTKVLKGFILFLSFMLFCTIVSRGIYAYQMPQVEMGQAVRKSIEHTFSCTGSINAVNEVPVLLPAGMLIDKVCVSEGELITADTVLIQLNMEFLTGIIDGLENRIALQKQQLKEIQSNRTLAEQTRQQETARAQENLNNVTQTQELAVQQARQRYEDAANALSAYPSWETYYDEKIRQDSQYQTLQNDPEQEEAFRIYEETLQASLQEAWTNGRETLQNAVKDAENTLHTAENNKNAAIAQAAHNVEDANKAVTDVKSSTMEIEQTIKDLQKELEVYQNLSQQEGRFYGGTEGTVQTINIQTGGKTPDTAAMVLVDGSQGWVFETHLTNEQMMYLNEDTNVTLKFQNGKKVLNNCPILTTKKLDDTSYLVTVDAGDEKLSQGELGSLEFAKQQGPYDNCVPASAIHTINDKNYLFVVRETSTILGTELHVVRRQVKIVDRNDSFVALEDGILGEEEQFVVNCDRDLKNGDAVRPMEASYLD